MAPHLAQLLFGVEDFVLYMVFEAAAWSIIAGFLYFMLRVFKPEGLEIHAFCCLAAFEYFWLTRFGFHLGSELYGCLVWISVYEMIKLVVDVYEHYVAATPTQELQQHQNNVAQNRPQVSQLSRRQRRQLKREQLHHGQEGSSSPRLHDDDAISISPSPTSDGFDDSATKNGMRQIRGTDKASTAVRGRIIRSRHVHTKHFVGTDAEAAALGIRPS